MEDLPAGLPDHDLRAGLARFRWFTSVSDLTTKPLARLRRAMETAASLGERLPFVVAPVRAEDGDAGQLTDERVVTRGEPHADSDFYSLRWAVNDIADFAVSLRAPHEQSRDAELTLHYFTETLKTFRASGSTCRGCRRQRWPRHGPGESKCRCASPTTGSS